MMRIVRSRVNLTIRLSHPGNGQAFELEEENVYSRTPLVGAVEFVGAPERFARVAENRQGTTGAIRFNLAAYHDGKKEGCYIFMR